MLLRGFLIVIFALLTALARPRLSSLDFGIPGYVVTVNPVRFLDVKRGSFTNDTLAGVLLILLSLPRPNKKPLWSLGQRTSIGLSLGRDRQAV